MVEDFLDVHHLIDCKINIFFLNDNHCETIDFSYLNNSAIGSTDSRPDGDNADKPLDELKCIFDLLGLGPPNARPEWGILLTPPCRIADGSSYIFG